MPTLKEEAAMRAVAKADMLEARQRRYICDDIQMIVLLPIMAIILMFIKPIEWYTGKPFVLRPYERTLTSEEDRQISEQIQKKNTQTFERGEKARKYLLERGYTV